MTELKEFKLPDVGEGLTEADIVAWHVKPGDQVEVNQIIVEIETAKAVVELPSPWDGTVPGCWPTRARPSTSACRSSRSRWRLAAVRPNDTAIPTEPARPPGPQPPASPPKPRAGRPGRLRRQGLVHHAPRAQAVAGHRAAAARPATAEVPTGPRCGPGGDRRPAVPPPGRWPSRRSAGWPRISASAWPTVAGQRPAGSVTRDDVQRAAADTTVRSGNSVGGSGAGLYRSPAAKSASRSGGCASTWPRPWCRARSPRRTSPSSCRST